MRLDVVSFAVPFPPVYGGAIDSYYRLKALSEIGVDIHLHAFTYGAHRPAEVLTDICKEVSYYRRQGTVGSLLSGKPYIMASRNSKQLLQALTRHEGPVLFDGMHTCAQIANPAIAHRSRYIRMHNIEWEYYLFLSQTADKSWKKLHFRRESRKLRRAEKEVINHARSIFAISDYDRDYYGSRHPDVHLVMPFHQFEDIRVQPGEGAYALLHGDLSIDDNLSTALKMASLCKEAQIALKVAGRSPTAAGLAKLRQMPNIDLYLDVSDDEMETLMRDAQIHIIDASITSGFKLKLISALFTARHVLARKTLVSKDLRSVVSTFSDSSEVLPLLKALMMRPIGPQDIALRKSVLLPRFSNSANAKRMADLMEIS